MNKIIYVLLSYTLIFTVQCNSKNQDNIKLLIEPLKDNPQADNIEIKIIFFNNSKKEIDIYCWQKKTISHAINNFLKFNITDINCDTSEFIYHYKGPQVLLPYENDFITISPKESYEEVITLNKYYILKSKKDMGNERSWGIGMFEIKCYYQYIHDSEYKYGNNLWEGKISSNKITINVK
jgi:hypothetical protein